MAAISAALVALTLLAAVGAASEQGSSPRLREGRLPERIPFAYGGGEVVLELTVDQGGAVTQIDRIRVASVVMPAYPPTATGDGIVLVEIEMSGDAQPRAYRVVSSASGFDTAALDAVRSWRFVAPQAADSAGRLFAYAVVGFRTPLAAR